MSGLDSSRFAAAARRIRLVGVDFDGVMTDNSVYVFEDGREAVRCSRFEGFGLRRLERAGIEAVIVSTEPNPVVAARARKLGVACLQNIADKAASLQGLLQERRLEWAQLAFIGNDINDLAVLRLAGLPIIVHDAHEDLNGLAAFRTKRPGGAGAVREACDAIASALEVEAGRERA